MMAVLVLMLVFVGAAILGAAVELLGREVWRDPFRFDLDFDAEADARARGKRAEEGDVGPALCRCRRKGR